MPVFPHWEFRAGEEVVTLKAGGVFMYVATHGKDDSVFLVVSPVTYKRRCKRMSTAIQLIYKSEIVEMADHDVQVPADGNL